MLYFTTSLPYKERNMQKQLERMCVRLEMKYYNLKVKCSTWNNCCITWNKLKNDEMHLKLTWNNTSTTWDKWDILVPQRDKYVPQLGTYGTYVFHNLGQMGHMFPRFHIGTYMFYNFFIRPQLSLFSIHNLCSRIFENVREFSRTFFECVDVEWSLRLPIVVQNFVHFSNHISNYL